MSAHPQIILIAAQSENRVIGQNGRMPWHLPRDLAYFKAQTLHFPIIMGRKTLQSLGRALPARRNIVLSRAEDFTFPEVEIFQDLPAALATITTDKVFIIGGGEIYRLALPYAAQVLLTEVATTIPAGEVFFPPLPPAEWQLVAAEDAPADDKNPFAMRFCTYQRRSVPPWPAPV